MNQHRKNKKVSKYFWLLALFMLTIVSYSYSQITVDFSPQSNRLICKDTTSIKIKTPQAAEKVAVYYKKRDAQTDFILIGETTSYVYNPLSGEYEWSFTWNISQLQNKAYYDIKVSVRIGEDIHVYDWVQIDRNPRANIISIGYSASIVGPYLTPVQQNNYYYVKSGYLLINLAFVDCVGLSLAMNTNIHPQAKLYIGNKSYDFSLSQAWFLDNIWTGVVNLPADVPNGPARIEITGAKSQKDYVMEPFVKENLIIDTEQPSVKQVKLDEDGDNDFTNNNGYLNLNETAKLYVWFSEYLHPEPTAYFKIGNKPFDLGNIHWLNTITIGGQTYGNYGYFVLPTITNIMGEGEAEIGIHVYPRAKDFAGNYLQPHTVKYKVDAVAPVPPIIYTPTTSTTVPKGSIIKVAIHDPQDQDVKFVVFYSGGYYVVDFNKPYEANLPADSTIEVTVYDKADNTSYSQVSINLLPEIDKKAPKARIFSVQDALSSLLKAEVNDTDVAEVKFQYSINKTTWVDISVDVNSPYETTWDVRNLTNGIYYLRAVAKDTNGNIDLNPTVTTVEKHSSGLRIYKESVSFTPPVKISLNVNLDNNKLPDTLDIKVVAKTKPYINVQILDRFGNLVYGLPSNEVNVTGSAETFNAKIPLQVIKSTGGYIYVNATVVDENNAVYTSYANAIVLPIDPQLGLNTSIIDIPANALVSPNTLIVEKTLNVPPADEDLVVLDAYNLRWAEYFDRFNSPVTINFYYNLINNIYPFSTANKNKFTICTWDGKKWIKDKDMSNLSVQPLSASIQTTHSSLFALVADYSKPKIEKFDNIGKTFYGKIIDTGSGITDANIKLTVNGVNYTATFPYGKYNVDTGDFYIKIGSLKPGVYPYTFEVIDNVGNKTLRTGVFTYTGHTITKDIHNYPNPFDPDKELTTIQFALSEYVSSLNFNIFDFNGELIYTTQLSGLNPGLLEFIWDGKNKFGDKVANGVYFGRIESENFKSEYFKIVVLRRK